MNSILHRALQLFLAILAAGLFCIPAAFSAFDPSNDDTDIFQVNPSIPQERPNILLVLDNTANWNNAFDNEKSALVSVINGLSDQFNVGLMMMAETGAGNDNVDGTYVRFHVRQMTNGSNGTQNNRAALSQIVQNLDKLGDKGNNNTVGLGLYEAFLYYAGRASNASYGKVKTDKTGTTDPILLALSGLRALSGSTATTLYNSPVSEGCQKNFIIYISNGPANENASARAFVEAKLTALNGGTVPATIPLSPSGQQGNWGDEMAQYLANADVNTNVTGAQNVVTYTVEVDPETTGQGADMTALMKSVASNGKGNYFAVSSSAGGTAIVDSLTKIFTEIQAVNSVFAASSLPVSASVQGAFLNQLYVGVFRPDGARSPRWYGNLKMYAFKRDSSASPVYLADANGVSAVNPNTGFISPNASSFWSTNSSFWGFRPANQNGVSGASDAPDGDIVEKGGAAQQIRLAYAAAEGSTPARQLFTCTTGGSKPDCVPNAGKSLSATPFDTTNTAITGTALGLGTRNVSPLTGYQSKAVTALTDRKSASLTNAASPVSVSSLNNGATTVTVASLKTSTPKPVSLLSAAVAGTQTVGLTSIVQTGSSTKITTVTANAPLPCSFVVGASITFTGTTSSPVNSNSYNGATGLTIASVNTATNTFTLNGAPNGAKDTTGGTASFTGSICSTTAKATLPNHGYASSDQITIAGALPAQFNGTFGITVVDANTFTYTITPAASDATGTITASGNTTTATAVTAAVHGLTAGGTVNISGATPSGYNGSFTVATVPNTTTFTYTVGSKLANNTGSPVYMVSGGSTTVTVTTAAAHGFADGATVNIANSDISGYNGSFVVAVTGATTFTFTTGSVLPANTSATVTASTGFLANVTATVTNHGFVAGDTVVIEGGTQALHTSAGAGSPSGFTVLASPAPTANTFTYSNPQLVAPAGAYTARPPTLSTKVTATVPAHGYTTGQQVVIAGATPAGYNGTFTITVVDANTFTYPLTSAPGLNTSTSVTSSIMSTTARATAVAHGFLSGDSVTISGATPAAFNGTFTIAKIDANVFEYTVAPAQGDATGTILAAGAISVGRGSLIRWVRGQDNFEDENINGSTSDIRASVHGDTLHSSPLVMNYGRYIDPATSKASGNDVYVFYGSNDGVFRAVKGGFATDAAAAVQILPGQEAWGFIPTEFFSSLQRLRTNSPKISSSFKKPYFADGPISSYLNDVNNDGKFVAADGDTVNLYIGMRRGGRFIYALDVKDPHDPKYLWKIDSGQTGFAELGQTWSKAVVVPGSATLPGLAGLPFPVLVFGAGYDPAVEDIDPAAITASDATSVTTGTGASTVVTNRTMGRGIYVVNALTGALIWRGLRAADACTSGCSTTVVSGMDFAIPSDIAVVRNQSGGPTNRAYVGDTGGNVWRIDFVKTGTNSLATSTVTKIAAVGAHTASGRRKFLYPPSVTNLSGIDTILMGSGDREHPFDITVTNRFYSFKDRGSDLGPLTGTSVANPTIVEGVMSDLTTNCIQDASACAVGVTQQTTIDNLALPTNGGWYITLSTGEKSVGNPVTAAGDVFFATNIPQSQLPAGTCGGLGEARLYQINAVDATATKEADGNPGLTKTDRSMRAGEGFSPPPDYRVIDLGSSPCVGIDCNTKPPCKGSECFVECVIPGFTCNSPDGSPLNARLRKYRFMEID